MKKFEFSYDPDAGVVTIEGVAYHISFFDALRDIHDGKFEAFIFAATPGNAGVSLRLVPVGTHKALKKIKEMLSEIFHD